MDFSANVDLDIMENVVKKSMNHVAMTILVAMAVLANPVVVPIISVIVMIIFMEITANIQLMDLKSSALSPFLRWTPIPTTFPSSLPPLNQTLCLFTTLVKKPEEDQTFLALNWSVVIPGNDTDFS